ncbi:hypothetical protein X975_26786, partial [Stegodyphus mimosarum]
MFHIPSTQTLLKMQNCNFSHHLKQISNKALKRLYILKRCVMHLGIRRKTLLNTYTSLVRTTLEYSAPIWAPASSSVKEKIDSVQYGPSKIITGAVSSTNNVKAETECGLASLENRIKLATIKFKNKMQNISQALQTISSSIKHSKHGVEKNRLKRSST